MKLKILPARSGWLWVRGGSILFFSHPSSFIAFFCMFGLLGTVLMAIPYVGGMLVLLSMPSLSLGMMVIGNEAVRQRRIQLGLVVPDRYTTAPFAIAWMSVRKNLPALLKLGLCFALGEALVDQLSQWLFGSVFVEVELEIAKAIQSGTTISGTEVLPASFLGALLFLGGIYILLSTPFWFSPALIHWRKFGLGKSLFLSTYATLKNWRAFGVFVVCWSMLCLLLLGSTYALATALLGGNLGLFFVRVMLMLFLCAFHASVFVTFVDCFTHPELVAATSEATKTPLSG